MNILVKFTITFVYIIIIAMINFVLFKVISDTLILSSVCFIINLVMVKFWLHTMVDLSSK